MTFGGTAHDAGRRTNIIGGGLVALFVLVGLSGCSEPAVTPPVGDPGFTAFLQDCQARTGMWRAGQIRYPATLSMAVGTSTSYTAAIDVGQQPVEPPTQIPGNATRVEPVQAQCAVAARLVPVGTLKVDPSDWSVRSFTPSARVDWAWTVSTEEAKDQQLRLEVQPAIRGADGFAFVGDTGPQTASFTTDVTVEATFLQSAYQYVSDNQAAALGIGAAVILALGFAGRLKKAVRKLMGRREQDDEDEDDALPLDDLVGEDDGEGSGSTDGESSTTGRAGES